MHSWFLDVLVKINSAWLNRNPEVSDLDSTSKCQFNSERRAANQNSRGFSGRILTGGNILLLDFLENKVNTVLLLFPLSFSLGKPRIAWLSKKNRHAMIEWVTLLESMKYNLAEIVFTVTKYFNSTFHFSFTFTSCSLPCTTQQNARR